MHTSFRCLAFCISTLAIVSCKDVTVNQQEVTRQTSSVSISNKDVAKAIANTAYQHTETILSFGHRQPESAGLQKSKDFVKAELKKHGWECVEQQFTAQTPKGPVRYSNLIARYAPNSTSPWRKSVKGVIGAHIDSKILPNFLGADDAASSVATIVALAQHLSGKHPDVAKKLELVFFDGEEAIGANMSLQDGLYGSRHYARAVQSSSASQLHPYKKTPQFGIVLDMIGHKDLHIAIPADTPLKLRKSYSAARKKLGLEKQFHFSMGGILDDHVPLNTTAKIPTIDIIGDFQRKNWWHTSNDSIDLISKDSLGKSIQMTLEILSNQL